MKTKTLFRTMGAVALASVGAGATLAQQAAPASTLLGVNCNARPIYHCEDGAVCDGPLVTQPGNTVEPQTRRTYFLDCPAGYRPGDDVNLVLSLHGGGSYANWQRHYAPWMDHKDKHKLVIMTPGSPTRSWTPGDDQFLQNIVDQVVGAVGKENVQRFVLAGHSQGGATSSRIICTPYFRDKVDVRISLSGGSHGPTTPAGRGFGAGGQPVYLQNPDAPPAAAAAGRGGAAAGRAGALGAGRGGAPGAAAGAAAQASASSPQSCDYSFVYTAGEYENMPQNTSPLATRLGCGPRERRPDIVDPQRGMVWDSTRQDPGTEGWGQYPRSGRAQVWVYPNCRDGRIVADVPRMMKGHTEGLEPNVTDEILRLALTDPGGKIRNGSWSPPATSAPGRGGGAPGRGG